MPAEESLRTHTPPSARRLEMRDRLATTHDREVLATVLHRVEQVGKVPSGVGRCHIRHTIRLSDRRIRSIGKVARAEGDAGRGNDEVRGVAGRIASPLAYPLAVKSGTP